MFTFEILIIFEIYCILVDILFVGFDIFKRFGSYLSFRILYILKYYCVMFFYLREAVILNEKGINEGRLL